MEYCPVELSSGEPRLLLIEFKPMSILEHSSGMGGFRGSSVTELVFLAAFSRLAARFPFDRLV
jgi:hypothetical protein